MSWKGPTYYIRLLPEAWGYKYKHASLHYFPDIAEKQTTYFNISLKSEYKIEISLIFRLYLDITVKTIPFWD